MYCKDCVFRIDGMCTNPHLSDDHNDKNFDKTTSLKYSFDESGWFEVGDYFGCVHFKEVPSTSTADKIIDAVLAAV